MKLFGEDLQVLNVGISSFAESIVRAGGKAIQIEWAPPAQGEAAIGHALAQLVNDERVEAANRKAFGAYLSSQPILEGIGVARNNIPGMGRRMILCAGPPIEWQRMCGPMKGAIIGAILLEGWAEDADAARKLAESGQVEYEPCPHHSVVGPMAGIISPSMPVWIVRDSEHGHYTFSNLNEGLGKALRFGANSPDVLSRLKWMAETLRNALDAAFNVSGPIELKPLMAQALHMGDEVHNRNAAATSLLLKLLAPALLKSKASRPDVAEAVAFIA